MPLGDPGCQLEKVSIDRRLSVLSSSNVGSDEGVVSGGRMGTTADDVAEEVDFIRGGGILQNHLEGGEIGVDVGEEESDHDRSSSAAMVRSDSMLRRMETRSGFISRHIPFA